MSNKVNNSYTSYMKDVEKYLTAKLPDIKECDAMDISSYVAARVAVLVNDAVDENNRMWKALIREGHMIKRKENSNGSN